MRLEGPSLLLICCAAPLQNTLATVFLITWHSLQHVPLRDHVSFPTGESLPLVVLQCRYLILLLSMFSCIASNARSADNISGTFARVEAHAVTVSWLLAVFEPSAAVRVSRFLSADPAVSVASVLPSAGARDMLTNPLQTNRPVLAHSARTPSSFLVIYKILCAAASCCFH